MVHHKQRRFVKPVQEPYYGLCPVLEPISRMTQYGFHNMLGYVNCKEVLEYDDIFVEALGNQGNFALAGG